MWNRLIPILFALAACDSASDPQTDATSDTAPDAVTLPPITRCPIDYASQGRSCTFEGWCGTPDECCGLTSRGSGCGCSGGVVSCMPDDTCFFTHCSPGCGPQEFATSAGCTACGEIDALVQRRLEAAAATLGTCDSASDCVAASATLSCGTYCDLAIARPNVDAFGAAANAIGVADCSFPTYYCATSGRCTPGQIVNCVDHLCASFAACDPSQTGIGDACDDGNPCTESDTCTGALTCIGKPASCDDGNPCTDDACDPSSGCTHLANVAACVASGPVNACSLGAECAEGACIASEVLGFTRIHAAPFRFASAITALPDGDGTTFVGGWQGEVQPTKSYILTLDPTGTITRTLVLDQLERLTDLIALADGGLLVAGEQFGEKSDVYVARLDASGRELWHFIVGGPASDVVPRLALSSAGATVAVTWFQESFSAHPTARVALSDLTGRAPLELSLGTAVTRYRPPDDFPQIAAGASDDSAVAFVSAHAGAVPDQPSTFGNVVVSRLANDGAILTSVTLESPDSEYPRGLLALPGGDVVAWGVHTAGDDVVDRWLRRVTPTGSIAWVQKLGVEHATFREGTIDALGTDPSDIANPVVAGAPWLARLDAATGIGTRLTMPRGPSFYDATPLPGGFAIVAQLGSPWGSTADTATWVRRAARDCPR